MRTDVVGGTFPRRAAMEGVAGPAGQLPWLGLPLQERQERALLQCGVSMESTLRDDERRGMVLVREDVTLTQEAVGDLIARGQAEGRDIRWRSGGRTGAFAEHIGLGDEEPWLVWLHAAGEGSLEDRIAAAEPVEFDPSERMLEFPVPRAQFGVDVLELPLSDRVVLPMGHWLQLLWANLLGLPPFLWRKLAGRNVLQVGWNIGWAVVLTRSKDPRVVAGALGRRGKNCRIHPSAVVEGCWLGDNVDIGANAVVRASVLADGASVEDLAMVEGCVLAKEATVQRSAMVKYSVIGAGASFGGVGQLSVLDRQAAVKLTAALMDQGLSQGVRVRRGEELVAAPLGLAGACVGLRSVVGAGVRVAPGRCIPADMEVLSSAENVLAKVPDGLTGKVFVKNGTLVSI